MTAKSNYQHANDPGMESQTGDESVLPLAVRRRLWDQIWTRLLAPPVDAADKAPAPQNRDARDGGQQ